jgi:3-hydroxyacyl-CoA dehydrogenase
MFVFKAAVVGGGVSGGTIAHGIASAGLPVVIEDSDSARVTEGVRAARALWESQVQAGKLAGGDVDRLVAMIAPSSGYQGFGDVDFVIESLADDLDLKQAVFAELDEVTPGHAILASDTATLSVTEIGAVTARPDKVIGFHFARPLLQMRAVEVIEGEYTSPETAQVAAGFAQTMRRTPIRCGDVPGLVVGRLLLSCLSEALLAQEETGASAEEIDTALAQARTLSPGPLRLADAIGLDTVLRLSEELQETYGDRFGVSPKLLNLVKKGHLGMSTGRGFHEHA